MKFKNCFIDEKGNVWKTDSLIEKSKGLPVFDFDVSLVDLDTIIRWKLINVRDYLCHYTRVRDSELWYPIILRSDGVCMDGWHRIIRAIAHGIKLIPAKKFIIDPEPDLNMNDYI